MRVRAQAVGRLVEADVAVGADAEDLQIDAAGRRDRIFVAAALGLQIGGRARSSKPMFAGSIETWSNSSACMNAR